ncbi:NAD(P)-binding protein [Prevotella sp. 10(H)]|uniref:NAD(P)-binding protein n=1 Tax=Prevotella sp. 10(H) TaxID=1158294 RepID=UPI0004A7159C|nr:NAD(P)-binding protein [Prevotella sp. 10(H)]
MDDKIYDCVIIGGGMSGISFAYYMRSIGKKVLVIEKDRNTGGQVQSIFSRQFPAYWREFGAHTCYNSYTRLLSIVKDIDRTDIIQPLGKGSYVSYSGEKIKKMMADVSFFSLMLNGPKLFFVSKKGKTVKEYFSKIVGKKNYEKVFTYLFRAVISQNADEYPAELFLKRRKDRYKEFPRKYSFKKGLSQFINSMIEKSNIEVVKESEVIDIKNVNGLFETVTLEGQNYYSHNVAIATDPQTASRLLIDIEEPLSDLLASVPLFHTESLNVIVPKDKLITQAVAGIIPISDEFHSAVSRDLVEDEKLRSFTFHFEKGEKNEEEKFAIICKVLNISRSDILEHKMIRHILPSLHMEHLDMAGQVEKARKSDNLYILGNYFHGLSLEDCVHRAGDEFKRFKNQGG